MKTRLNTITAMIMCLIMTIIIYQPVVLAQSEDTHNSLTYTITKNSITVNAKGFKNISDARVILAIYNENEDLEQLKTKDYSEEVTFNDIHLTKGHVKVMLWKGLVPLTEATEKNFILQSPSYISSKTIL